MNIKFLGTAAAEGWPALFCKCESCNKARALGGKNIRTRSSCLIDDKYMVDFPPDTYMHMLNNRLDMSKVEHLIITHSHGDHFYPEDMHMRKEPYAHIYEEKPLVIYGNSHVKKGFYDTDVEEDSNERLVFKEVYPFKKYQAGEASIIPMLADHDAGEECYIYIIELNGKVLLYGHDTGYFPESTWDFLRNLHIDAAIFDCTGGPREYVHYHMGFPTVLRVKKRLEEQGCIDNNTILVITHFSHNGEFLHDELESMASPHGFITAYDGMEICV